MTSTKLTLSASAQRVLAVATAGALLPLGLAGAASAQTTTPKLVDITQNACAGTVPDAGYTDVSGVSAENKLAINCISGYGIAKGTTATTYNPTGVVNRSQMALFLTRLATTANVTLDSTDAGFTDISGETAVAQTAINQLANLGVAKGKTATTYAPGEGVSRAQMASFINRLQAVIEKKTPTTDSFAVAAGTNDYFTDDNGSVAEADINAIAAGGIAAGTGGTLYSPSNGVSRAQMALFLARDLEVNVKAGTITSKYPPAQALESVKVTPTDAATLALLNDNTGGATPVADNSADNRSFTVTGLDNTLTYSVTLLNGDSVKGDAGARTFKSSQIGTTGKYEVNVGTDIADIVNVNNGAPLAADTNSTNTKPVNGAITFTIDGTAPGTVVPAVYVLGAAGGTSTTGGNSAGLETSATKAGDFAAASETFGLGGPTTFTAPQAQNGTIAPTTVSSVTKGTNMFTTGTLAGTVSYTFDANDTYTVDGQSVGQAAFVAALSRGDGISGTYTRDAAGVSNFILADTNPGTAPAPTATTGTNANSNQVTVTATLPGAADTVEVFRAKGTGTATAPVAPADSAYASIASGVAADSDAATAGNQFSYVDKGLAPGIYYYKIKVTTDGQAGTISPASAPAVTTSPAADTVSPFSNDARVSTDNGFANQADAGDVFTISFSEPLATPAAGATLRIQDTAVTGGTDNTVVDVVNGTNATFTLNTTRMNQNGATREIGTVLTVTLTASPTVVSAGAISGLQYSADTSIINSSGITDVAGNRYDLGTSTDRGLEVAANTTAPLV